MNKVKFCAFVSLALSFALGVRADDDKAAIEKWWSDQAESAYAWLQKNPQKALTWLAPRLNIPASLVQEGESRLETFAASAMPNAWSRYEKAKERATEIQQVFREEFAEPETMNENKPEWGAYCKVLKRLCEAREVAFRLHDELCHYYLLHKTGVMSKDELATLDESPVSIRLGRIPSKLPDFKLPEMVTLEEKHVAFAEKYLPETLVAYQKIETENGNVRKLFAEIEEDVRVMDIVRFEHAHSACFDKIETLTERQNATAKELQKYYMDHRMGDLESDALAEIDSKNRVSLSEFISSIPKLIAAAVNAKAFDLIKVVPIPGRNYKMGATEVTQSQWQMVMGDNPSYFKGGNRPVENVSWDDVQEFIAKLNNSSEVQKAKVKFRLPTGTEWAHACRAGGTGDWGKRANGVEGPLDVMGWFRDNSGKTTHPVAQKEPNAWGLYDMHGNVCEWTSIAGGDVHVPRGGGWDEISWNCKAGYWDSSSSMLFSHSRNIGFRLVMEATDDLRSIAIKNLISEMRPMPKRGYKMAKSEVTQSLWEFVMGDNPSEYKASGNHPVENVSWNDVQKFIEKLNGLEEVREAKVRFRLPTEEEWMYACRAGGNEDLANERQLASVGWFKKNSQEKIHEVCQRRPNAWGLYDMHGNVLEWTSTDVGNGRMAVKGGCWLSEFEDCKVAYQGSLERDKAAALLIGFRLVMESDEKQKEEKVSSQALAHTMRLPKMVAIPGKTYKMGVTEVTQDQWKWVMGDNPSKFKGSGNLPVENVSWSDVQKFIEKLNAMPEAREAKVKFRLPTKEEWNYACRAGGSGDLGKRANGQEGPVKAMGWYDKNSEKKTHPVAQKEPNAWGIYDMHGNVWEWTVTTRGDKYEVVGGSWRWPSMHSHVGVGITYNPNDCDKDVGFRLVMESL